MLIRQGFVHRPESSTDSPTNTILGFPPASREPSHSWAVETARHTSLLVPWWVQVCQLHLLRSVVSRASLILIHIYIYVCVCVQVCVCVYTYTHTYIYICDAGLPPPPPPPPHGMPPSGACGLFGLAPPRLWGAVCSTEVWYGCCRLLAAMSSLRALSPPPLWGGGLAAVCSTGIWYGCCRLLAVTSS